MKMMMICILLLCIMMGQIESQEKIVTSVVLTEGQGSIYQDTFDGLLKDKKESASW
ncbi:MAG: hypothetical protein HUU50_14535 [Candidatus Brocadiae bacterium]|nr:hypothetical protein [Candidatus Brocadiia bacterium]